MIALDNAMSIEKNHMLAYKWGQLGVCMFMAQESDVKSTYEVCPIQFCQSASVH